MLSLPPYANTLHVLSNCKKCLNRYIWRHNSVLNSLLQQFFKTLKTSSKIYCDNNKLQYNTTSQLFTTQRPDIAILDGNEMTVIKLMKSRKYKIKRYKDLKSHLLQPLSNVKVLLLEIASLGCISKQSYEPFAKYQYSNIWEPLFVHHTLYFLEEILD